MTSPTAPSPRPSPTQYFNASGALTPYYYWIGVQRASNASDYLYTFDNSSLPQLASDSPYAHWSWVQQVAAKQSGFDCVIAQGSYAYDVYQGNSGLKALANPALYTTNDPMFTSKKYG